MPGTALAPVGPAALAIRKRIENQGIEILPEDAATRSLIDEAMEKMEVRAREEQRPNGSCTENEDE